MIKSRLDLTRRGQEFFLLILCEYAYSVMFMDLSLPFEMFIKCGLLLSLCVTYLRSQIDLDFSLLFSLDRVCLISSLFR